MLRLLVPFLLLVSFYPNSLNAQLTPDEAVAGMARGINLGNTLEPPLESGWNNGPAQESYFDAYVEAGFTNVRVPVRWDQHTDDNSPYQIDESWMDRVEEVIDWGLSRGLYITLNGHHEDWLKSNYNQNNKDRYDAIWTQVAERFKDKSDRLLFEIINEPIGMTVAQVDELNFRILDIIRENNPTRIVIYGGNMYSNSEQLFDAAIPDDEYIVGYYHAYDPWQFAGQSQGTWGSASEYQQLTNKFQSVKSWSDNNNIPVHLSEFGAMVNADFNSRMRIYAHNVEMSISNGFAFSVWDDGGDFKILKRETNSWPETKDILVHYHQDSPNEIFSSLEQDPGTEAKYALIEWNNRAIDNGDIIIERAIGTSDIYNQIATLPSSATSYEDYQVSQGVFTYRMYTNRADGTLLHGYPTRVNLNGGVQSSFTGTPITIPGIVEVEDYDIGGEGIAYHDMDATNQGGGYRLDEGVDIGGGGDDFVLGYVASGEWIEYTVDVTQSGTYSVTAETASPMANGGFSITLGQNDAIATFSTPNTGGWNTYNEIAANNEIVLEQGFQILRLDITSGTAFNADRIKFTLESATDIKEEVLKSLSISPNPTRGFVDIEFVTDRQNTTAKLIIFDIAGAKINEQIIKTENAIVDLSSYEKGTYLFQFISQGASISYKVIKQ